MKIKGTAKIIFAAMTIGSVIALGEYAKTKFGEGQMKSIKNENIFERSPKMDSLVVNNTDSISKNIKPIKKIIKHIK